MATAVSEMTNKILLSALAAGTLALAANPANADEGTIRHAFGESIEANSVHGSDSAENAAIEIGFFFRQIDIVG